MTTPIKFDGIAVFSALHIKRLGQLALLERELAVSHRGDHAHRRRLKRDIQQTRGMVQNCLDTLEELELEAAARNASDRATHNAFHGLEDAPATPRRRSRSFKTEDMGQAELCAHRLELLVGLASCALAAPDSAELAEEQLRALADLAQRPGALDFRQADSRALLLAAVARTWRVVHAKDLAALLDPAPAGSDALESSTLEELASAANPGGDSAAHMLETLAGFAAGWLSEALDPRQYGGCMVAVVAPCSEQDRELLAFRFAENFPLELERERSTGPVLSAGGGAQ